jgi:hypothetical protein
VILALLALALARGLIVLPVPEQSGYVAGSVAIVGGAEQAFVALQPAVAAPGLSVQDLGAAGCLITARAVFTAATADLEAAAARLRIAREDLAHARVSAWSLRAVRAGVELWKQEGALPLTGYAPMSFTLPSCAAVSEVELRGAVEWTELVGLRASGALFSFELSVPVTRSAVLAVRLKQDEPGPFCVLCSEFYVLLVMQRVHRIQL